MSDVTGYLIFSAIFYEKQIDLANQNPNPEYLLVFRRVVPPNLLHVEATNWNWAFVVSTHIVHLRKVKCKSGLIIVSFY